MDLVQFDNSHREIAQTTEGSRNCGIMIDVPETWATHSFIHTKRSFGLHFSLTHWRGKR